MKLNITMDGRRFYRSDSDKWILGICGGVAEHFGWKPSHVRICTAALGVLLPGVSTAAVGLAYLILGILIPSRDQA